MEKKIFNVSGIRVFNEEATGSLQVRMSLDGSYQRYEADETEGYKLVEDNRITFYASAVKAAIIAADDKAEGFFALNAKALHESDTLQLVLGRMIEGQSIALGFEHVAEGNAVPGREDGDVATRDMIVKSILGVTLSQKGKTIIATSAAAEDARIDAMMFGTAITQADIDAIKSNTAKAIAATYDAHHAADVAALEELVKDSKPMFKTK